MTWLAGISRTANRPLPPFVIPGTSFVWVPKIDLWCCQHKSLVRQVRRVHRDLSFFLPRQRWHASLQYCVLAGGSFRVYLKWRVDERPARSGSNRSETSVSVGSSAPPERATLKRETRPASTLFRCKSVKNLSVFCSTLKYPFRATKRFTIRLTKDESLSVFESVLATWSFSKRSFIFFLYHVFKISATLGPLTQDSG